MEQRYAILSDIHSNLEALQATLADMDRRGIPNLAVLGDTGGRGSHTEECLDLVRTRATVAVFGNWEVATHAHLSLENRDFIESLPFVASLGEALLVHASPVRCDHCDSVRSLKRFIANLGSSYWPSRLDYFPYLSGKGSLAVASERLKHLGKRLLFHGHTHRQQVWVSRVDGELVKVGQSPIDVSPADGECAYLLGVGSVGQASAGLAQYAIWDIDEEFVELVTLG